MAAIDFRYRINSQPYAGEADDVTVQKFIVAKESKKKKYYSWVELATNIGRTAGENVHRLSRVAERAPLSWPVEHVCKYFRILYLGYYDNRFLS